MNVIKWHNESEPSLPKLRTLFEKINLKPEPYALERDEKIGPLASPTNQILIVAEGVVEISADGRLARLEAGDRADLHKGTIYSLRNISKGQSVLLKAIP